MFDAARFLTDHVIDNTTEGNHARPGWVQIHCPFCPGGDGNYHLGLNLLSGEYGNCWRCGGHSMPSIIQALLHVPHGKAVEIFKQYSGRSVIRRPGNKPIFAKSVLLPIGAGPMTERHRRYLDSRGLDPEYLERTFGLRGTGPVGDYRLRIVAPVYLNGKLISYTGRDITGQSKQRWKGCAKENEVYPHKQSLYAIDLAKGDRCVVVEGPSDVWRLGPGAVGAFGINMRPEQLRLLSDRFKTVFFCFDAEAFAQKQGEKMVGVLTAAGAKCNIIRLEDGDPGGLTQAEADNLMREIGLKT